MKKKTEKLGYKPTGTHHHGVCWCSGTITAPGNQQPPLWIDCAIAATWAYHVTNKRTHTCVCVLSADSLSFVCVCVCFRGDHALWFSGINSEVHLYLNQCSLIVNWTNFREIPLEIQTFHSWKCIRNGRVKFNRRVCFCRAEYCTSFHRIRVGSYERFDVSGHRHLGWLSNSLLKLTSKTKSMLCIAGLLWWEYIGDGWVPHIKGQ